MSPTKKIAIWWRNFCLDAIERKELENWLRRQRQALRVRQKERRRKLFRAA